MSISPIQRVLRFRQFLDDIQIEGVTEVRHENDRFRSDARTGTLEHARATDRADVLDFDSCIYIT